MRRAAHMITVALLSSGAVLALQSPAFAPCHIVQWVGEPYRVNENKGSVTISVTNGGNAPSTVNYATVDGTAKASKDYTAKSGFIRWPSPSGAAQSFTVPILNDRVHEPDETFKMHLSHPTGCELPVKLPPDARVTIRDDDPAPVHTVTASKSATTTKTATASATPSPSPSKSASPSKSVTPSSPTPTGTTTGQAAAARKGGGVSGGLIGGIVVAGVLIAAIAYGLLRRRRTI